MLALFRLHPPRIRVCIQCFHLLSCSNSSTLLTSLHIARRTWRRSKNDCSAPLRIIPYRLFKQSTTTHADHLESESNNTSSSSSNSSTIPIPKSFLTNTGHGSFSSSPPPPRPPSFPRQKKGFWTDVANHRIFLDWVAQQLNVREYEDWYRVTRDDIRKLGGRGMLSHHYNDSLIDALAAIYPEFDWLPWKFASGVPRGFWNDTANHRKFFDWAAEQLGVKNPEEDWYRIKREDINNLGGIGLLTNHYDDSLIKALSAVYPSIAWLRWRFHHGSVPRSFWSDMANQRKFFDWAAKQLRIDKPEDWYRVTNDDIRKLGGAGLLTGFYEGSFVRALLAVYGPSGAGGHAPGLGPGPGPGPGPGGGGGVSGVVAAVVVEEESVEGKGERERYHDHDGSWLLPWKFSGGVYDGFWSDMANRRWFFDWAAEQLGVRDEEGWYLVSREQIYKLGGTGLLNYYYEGSLVRALSHVYPTVQWQPWRFRRFVITSTTTETPSSSSSSSASSAAAAAAATVAAASASLDPRISDSDDDNNDNDNDNTNNKKKETQLLKQYVEFLTSELHINSLDDWYRVSMQQIRRLGGYAIITQHGGLQAVLNKLFPQHDWSDEKLHAARGKRSSQRWLRIALRKLFPHEEIIEEYYHPNIRFDNGEETQMTFDLWIPSLRLAFEYQGQHHFHDIHFYGDPAKQKERDAEKVTACAKAGITLISIPYWWDRSVESIAEAILHVRPDIAAMPEGSLVDQAARHAKGPSLLMPPNATEAATTTTTTRHQSK